MNTTKEVIHIDEGEGYYYPSHEETNRRTKEFWDGTIDGTEGGLMAPPDQWENGIKPGPW